MLHVGTSGFSYDDWIGPWYPPGLAKGKMFDHYADRFGAVEINSTFYHTPGPGMAASLARRGAGRVTFVFKAPRAMTHEGDLSQGTVAAMRRAIEPAEAAGRLGAVLHQFPFRFHCTGENRAYLIRALAALGGAPGVAEIRHASWQTAEGEAFFRDRGIHLCVTDMPRLRGLPVSRPEAHGAIAYVRFHGRNGREWFNAGNAAAPYDYLYSPEELEGWVEPIRTLRRKAETTFVFFNNHLHGQAAQNAEMMLALLGEAPRAGAAQGDLFGGG